MRARSQAIRMLLMITDVKDTNRIEQILFDAGLPIYYQWRGQGTARAEWLDVCGLSGRSRLLTLTCLPQNRVREILGELENNYQISQRGKGIAATVVLNGMQASLLRVLQPEDDSANDAADHANDTAGSANAADHGANAAVGSQNMDNNDENEGTNPRSTDMMDRKAEYTMILTAVRDGYSDAVVDAAVSAGAKGGSVIHGRRRGSEALTEFMGIPMQEEQEFVMIITRREHKTEIMNAISHQCGLNTEARGFVFSVPLEDVIGMA